MNIHRFESLMPRTEFAPVYRYFMFEKSLLGLADFDQIKKTVLEKEKSILADTQEDYEKLNHDNASLYDGGTGLGSNSLTSRSPFFNVLGWEEMADLKKAIRGAHDDFLSGLGIDPNRKIYAQCWANVMRKGQAIRRHHHGTNQYAYISGHVSVQVNNTATYYTDPYSREEIAVPNQVGMLTLFPSWVDHRTDMVRDNQERITIAFDSVTEIGFQEDIIDSMKHHWLEI